MSLFLPRAKVIRVGDVVAGTIGGSIEKLLTHTPTPGNPDRDVWTFQHLGYRNFECTGGHESTFDWLTPGQVHMGKTDAMYIADWDKCGVLYGTPKAQAMHALLQVREKLWDEEEAVRAAIKRECPDLFLKRQCDTLTRFDNPIPDAIKEIWARRDAVKAEIDQLLATPAEPVQFPIVPAWKQRAIKRAALLANP